MVIDSNLSNLADAVLVPLQLALKTQNKLIMFFCGNPARGDDGAGFLLYQKLNKHHDLLISQNRLKLIYDHQWQVEDACELGSEGLFVFVDASAQPGPPFSLSAVKTTQRMSSTSHSLSPSQLLGVADQVGIQRPEILWQLGIAGERFGLGEEMSLGVKRSCASLTQAINKLVENWCTS